MIQIANWKLAKTLEDPLVLCLSIAVQLGWRGGLKFVQSVGGQKFGLIFCLLFNHT